MPKRKVKVSTRKRVVTKKTQAKIKTKVTKKSVVLKRKHKRTIVLSAPRKNRFIWAESYTSLLMGIVFVIVIALFVGSLLRTHHTQEVTSTSISPSITPSPSQNGFLGDQKTYTVQPGDDLWHIAEKFYTSGYYWTQIAKANNLDNPGILYSGTKLMIPSVTPIPGLTITPTPTEMPQQSAITTDTYTVQKGDTLWDIAVKSYNDGYKWTQIAKANNLENPGVIFSGNVLKIPR